MSISPGPDDATSGPSTFAPCSCLLTSSQIICRITGSSNGQSCSSLARILAIPSMLAAALCVSAGASPPPPPPPPPGRLRVSDVTGSGGAGGVGAG
nr:unnamed protein product [Digitaria exilis]